MSSANKLADYGQKIFGRSKVIKLLLPDMDPRGIKPGPPCVANLEILFHTKSGKNVPKHAHTTMKPVSQTQQTQEPY